MSIEEQPKVSIITSAFNAATVIGDAYASIISQTYTNWEWLVTDDLSTDNTWEILNAYAKNDSRIKILHNTKNVGAGASRNKSIEESSGRFIAFLDSDDMWHKDKLKKQIGFMLEHSYALTYTAYEKMTMSGDVIHSIIPPDKVSYHELLKSNVIGCLTAIYDAKVLGKIYMPTIRKRQDMALWLKILEKIDYAYCLNENLALYRVGNNTLSSNKLKVIFSQWSFYRNYLKFGILKSIYYFSHYAFRAVKKHGVKK